MRSKNARIGICASIIRFPGFRKLFASIRRSDKIWNHKKVYRVYKLLKLNKKRKGPAKVKQPLAKQAVVNASLSMDFMSDSMVGNRKFRTLNVMDDCSCEALAIEIHTSLSSKRVIGVVGKDH